MIIGAAGGIGTATARVAANAGNRVVLAGRDTTRLDALAAELGPPERVLTGACDVTDWGRLRALIDRVSAGFGRLDVVFANAGQFSGPPLLGEIDAPEAWRDMVLTNIYGTALTAHATWPLLTASRGDLVMTGSVTGRVTVPGQLYSATRWAVTALGQSLRAGWCGATLN